MTATLANEDVLAVDGGTPVRNTPMPKRHLFGEEEKQVAMALFDNAIETGNAFGYGGPEERAFDEEFAAFMGGGYADGVNSGTNAVFVALGALQLPAGSEVIVPPITDAGGAMPVVLLNCIPVFADAAPGSFNIGPEQFEAAITENTKAVVVAHIAGEPADITAICDIAKRHNIRVVEDCAQAHGAKFNGQLLGTFGDIAAFSTMSGKHFATAAQGGVVFTTDETLHWQGKRFADRGKPFNLTGAGGNVVPGLNCNLNDLAGAVGRVQLRKLSDIVAKRQAVGERVKAGLESVSGISLGRQEEGGECSYWFMRVHLDANIIGVDKATFVAALQAEGIPSAASYDHQPRNAPWVRNPGWNPWAYGSETREIPEAPNATAATSSHFTIACHERYGEQEADDIIAAVRKVANAFGNA